MLISVIHCLVGSTRNSRRYSKKLLTLAAAVIVATASIIAAHAQQVPGMLDPSYNLADIEPGAGESFNKTVQVIVLQNDGKFMVGGEFTTYNGASRNMIARLNADGTLDKTFNPGTGFNGIGLKRSIKAIAVQPDGKVIVGGDIGSFNGTLRTRIARLNANGSLDASFNIGTGFNSTVNAIVVQTDGKIIVGGDFTNYNGSVCNRIARLNSDGTFDTTYKTGTGFNGQVTTMALQSDGLLVVGGWFTSFFDYPKGAVARLHTNGSLDHTYNAGTGFNGVVMYLTLQRDGKAIIKGGFSAFDGKTRYYHARLLTDGSLDQVFNPSSDINGGLALTVDNDEKVLLAGSQLAHNSSRQNSIARLNSNGIVEEFFKLGTAGIHAILSIVVQSDGKWVVGGSFTTQAGAARNYIARLHPDGTIDTTFNAGTGFNSLVTAIAIQKDGKALVAGQFTTFNNTPRHYLARLHSDGTLDTSFNIGKGFNYPVLAVALQSDGKVILGGQFTEYNGKTCKTVVRLNTDGTLDDSYSAVTYNNYYYVQHIALQPDGDAILGGAFTANDWMQPNKIIRLKANGSWDKSYDPYFGRYTSVQKIMMQSDGKAVVAGPDWGSNQPHRKYIYRLNTDGTLDESFNPDIDDKFIVYAMTQQRDGRLLLAGYIPTNSNIIPTQHLVLRLKTNGALDNTFTTGTGFDNFAYSVVVQEDNKIVVGGAFSVFNGTECGNIVRLQEDGSLDTGFSSGTGFNNTVQAMAVQSDGHILIGGLFFVHGQVGRNKVARLIISEGTTLGAGTEQQPGLDMLVYPNPSKGDILVEVTGAEKIGTAIELVLYNSLGRQVYSGEITAAEARSEIKLPTAGMAGGVYFLSISTKGRTITKRLVLVD